MPDTEVAAAFFDGIIYPKGAAALKQLLYVIGAPDFKKALQQYFTAFAWSNVTTDDFINSISPSFPVAQI